MIKRIVSVAVLIASMSSFAVSLLPADHKICLNATNHNILTKCAYGTEFYTASDGRCGCLSKDDFYSIDTCKAAHIICEEDAGETYSTLYQSLKMCGMYNNVEVGCGCFTSFGSGATTIVPENS